MKEHNRFSKISDAELVMLCRRNDQAAWNAFFQKFNPKIDMFIDKTLRSNGIKVDTIWHEGFWKIKDRVIDDILGKIHQYDVKKSLPGWIKVICRSRTIDWLRKVSIEKNAYQQSVEKTIISLDQYLDKDGSRTLMDIIPDDNFKAQQEGWNRTQMNAVPCENEAENDLTGLVQKLKNCILELKENYQLPLKLFWILYLELSDNDINKIARIRGAERAVIEEEIKIILNRLKVKEKSIHEKEKKLANLSVIVLRLEMQINKLKFSPLMNKEKIRIKEKKLQKKIIQREKLIRIIKSTPPVIPSYREIAGVLGWDDQKAKTLNSLLFRARKAMKKKLEHANHSNRSNHFNFQT